MDAQVVAAIEARSDERDDVEDDAPDVGHVAAFADADFIGYAVWNFEHDDFIAEVTDRGNGAVLVGYVDNAWDALHFDRRADALECIRARAKPGSMLVAVYAVGDNNFGVLPMPLETKQWLARH